MRVDAVPGLASPCGPETHSFLVGQDRDGYWVAVETHGFGAGIFKTRDAAMHYALGETAKRPGAVSLAEAPLAWG